MNTDEQEKRNTAERTPDPQVTSHDAEADRKRQEQKKDREAQVHGASGAMDPAPGAKAANDRNNDQKDS